MKIGLGSNIGALRAQQRVTQLDREVSALMERLASGSRINRASDDPAGNAVLQTLNAERRVYARGIKNIGDAISAVSIMESAVRQLEQITERQLELAEAAANGTITGTQRAAIHVEVNALVEEYNRILKTTSFNGIALLDCSQRSMTIQEGYSTYTFDPLAGLLRTTGSGAFGGYASSSYDTNTIPREIATADLNGDGVLDIVTDNMFSRTVSVNLGNADGTFQAATNYNIENQTYDVELGDFNGDGHIDIATADFGTTGTGDTASILLNNGDGTFAPYSTTQVGAGVSNIVAGDLNGDGFDDLIAARTSSLFSSGSGEASSLVCGSAAGITSGQYFLLNTPTTEYYVWYRKDGVGVDPALAGKTGILVDITSAQTAAQVAAATAAILNPTAAFTAASSTDTVTIRNEAIGPVADGSIGTLPSTFTFTVRDDGLNPQVDTATDIITVNGHGFQTGDRVYLTSSWTVPGGLAEDVDYYVIAVDGDHLKFATNLANAQAGVAIDLTSTGSGIYHYIWGRDVSGGSVQLSNGDGTFTSAGTVRLTPSIEGLLLEDVDRDGTLDLITVDSRNDSVEVRLGTGGGGFGSAQTYTVGDNPKSIEAGDFNADGILDLATADYQLGTSTVLLGTAGGAFTVGPTLTNGAGTRDVTVADFNGDGYDDVVAANYLPASHNVSVHLSNGDGTFASPLNYDAGTAPSGIAAGDFNLDGAPDIAVADRSWGGLRLLFADNITTTTETPYLSLTGADDALHALDTLQENLDRIHVALGSLGAVQASLTSAATQMTAMESGTAEAAERISSADVAVEAAELLKKNILKQAATAILAQANQQPALALKLLG